MAPLSLTSADTAGRWTYNLNNELGGYDGTSFLYDANGNTVQKTEGEKVTRYIYNVENRLARVEDESGRVTAEYDYDPFGRRLWKEVDGERTCFVYSDEGLVGECDDTGSLRRSYGYAPGSAWTTDPLFLKESGQYYFYQNDHLGTPQKMTAANGAAVWSAKYSCFGKAQIEIETVENNLRFPGQFHDPETGLHYNHHRYCDPTIGRYLTPDPIGLEGGINLFLYVMSNPINSVDPSGLVTGQDVEQFLISLGRNCVPLPSKQSDWEIAWKGSISYHVDAIFADAFGPVGAAHWMKKRRVREEREVIRRWFCCECNECGCECETTYSPPTPESRYLTKVLEHFHGKAYRISQGYDPEGGDFWWSINPWTGETVSGRMSPGP